MPELSTGHIFMSYSRKDEKVMRRILIFLRNQGIQVWVDNEKLIPGTPIWEVEVEKAITNAKAIIVILSPNSKDSEWVRREIGFAEQYRKRIFPVLARGDSESSTSIRLINIQYVDIRKNEERGLNELSNAFLDHLATLESEEEAREKAEKLAKAKREASRLKVKQKTLERILQDGKKPVAKNKIKYDTKNVDQKDELRTSWLAGRLLYRHFIRGLSKDSCARIIYALKAMMLPPKDSDSTFTIYQFLTTSRSAEEWLQAMENKIYRMRHEKTPTEWWMVIGGYGSGKSHLANYLMETTGRIPNVKSIELSISSHMNGNSIFSLILINTKTYLDALIDNIYSKSKSAIRKKVTESIRRTVEKYIVDPEFTDALTDYGKTRTHIHGDFERLEELMARKGNYLFLPLMKMYKKELGINGIFVSIDEFEVLQSLNRDAEERFVLSMREIFDALASTYPDAELPSFTLVVLCTLSYWAELDRHSSFQAVKTRAHQFEIFPLVEDEIITLAEKLYMLCRKSGQLRHEFRLDFTKIGSFIIKEATLYDPLTPRFLIRKIIDTIENPEEFIRFQSLVS